MNDMFLKLQIVIILHPLHFTPLCTSPLPFPSSLTLSLSPSPLLLSPPPFPFLPFPLPLPLSPPSFLFVPPSSLSSQETTLQHVLQTSDVNMTEMEGWARLPHDLQQELQMLVTATADPSHQHEPSLLHQHDSSLRHRHTNVSSALGRESEVGIC